MTEMGTATIYPTNPAIGSMCETCKKFSRCVSGEGTTLTIHGIRHLFLPDYKNSWVLIVDLPDCKNRSQFFTAAKISASLLTGNRAKVEGKVFKVDIGQSVELNVVEI